MNFKYFLRGLGVGIVFSAIICLAVYNGRENIKMSDEEIIHRAKQLGYVKEDDVVERQIEKLKNENKETTSDNINTKDEKSQPDSELKDASVKEDSKNTTAQQTTEQASTEEKSSEQKSTESVTTEKVTTEKATTEAEKSTTENKTEEKKSDKKNEEEVTFSIEAGSSSYPVCLKLKELGLVDNAEEFDTFLVENGYANRISVGSHSLKKGMSYHDIAEAISDPLESE